MSQYTAQYDHYRIVFGWDQPLQTFFIQVHDKHLPEEANPFMWNGAKPHQLYEVKDLIRITPRNLRPYVQAKSVELYADKDEGR